MQHVSNQSPFGRVTQAFPTLPKGDVLGTFETYPEAQRAVAQLAAADFPVGRLSIVGNDLKTVERVTGKLTYGRAALAGAVSGLWLGIFFGIVLELFSANAPVGMIGAAAIIGAAFGVLYGVVSFSVTKRQRDFTSVHQVLASNYQIVIDPQLIGRARQILGGNVGAYPGGPTHFPPSGQYPSQQAPHSQQQWHGDQPPQPGRYQQPGQPPQQGQYPQPHHPGQHQQPGQQSSPYGSAWQGVAGAGTDRAAGGTPTGERPRPRYGELAPEPAEHPVEPPVEQPHHVAPEHRPEPGSGDAPDRQAPESGQDDAR